MLIVIFLVRKTRPDLIRRFGWLYLLLAAPAVCGLFLAAAEHKAAQYVIFLAIFLAFLVMEWLYDYVWKVPFRENWDWKFMAPYLALYYAMNYGFVVMPWKTSRIWGIIMAVLFFIQIITNLRSHPRKTG
jgi:hypothetical protein